MCPAVFMYIIHRNINCIHLLHINRILTVFIPLTEFPEWLTVSHFIQLSPAGAAEV